MAVSARNKDWIIHHLEGIPKYIEEVMSRIVRDNLESTSSFNYWGFDADGRIAQLRSKIDEAIDVLKSDGKSFVSKAKIDKLSGAYEQAISDCHKSGYTSDGPDLSALKSLVEKEITRLKNKADDAPRHAVPISNIRSKSQVILYAQAIIIAFEDVLSYQSDAHSNRPQPDLYIDDAGYLKEISKLVVELRRLNSILSSKNASNKTTSRKVSSVHKHFDTFFGKFAGSLGTTLGSGTGGLLIGTAGALLYQAGIAPEAVQNILARIRV